MTHDAAVTMALPDAIRFADKVLAGEDHQAGLHAGSAHRSHQLSMTFLRTQEPIHRGLANKAAARLWR
jgi:hypothetical protein